MDYIGLDIGGTSIKAGLVDPTGQILESQKAPTIIDDLNGFLSNLSELIRNFQKSFNLRRNSSRPREIRDFTVPIPTSRAAAVSS